MSEASSTSRFSVALLLRSHRVLVIVLCLAVGLRLFTMAVYSPSVLQWFDAPRFARTGEWTGFFSDFWTPAGYAAFLWALRLMSHNLAFTIGVQHLLGVSTGLLFAATAHRAGVRSPWHLVAGAAVFFGGDFLYLEHLVMAEALMLFLIAAGLYATVRSIDDARPLVWSLAASALVALAALVRWNGSALFIAPIAIGLLRSDASIRRRIAGVLAAVLPFLLLVGVYEWGSTRAGQYSGIGDMHGWLLYGRVAPFLDCKQTTADDRFPELCETVPPGSRPGSFYYTWDIASPARSLWGLDPSRSDDLFALGIDTVIHEPLAYARAVGRDVARLVDPTLPMPGYSGQAPALHEFRYRDPEVEKIISYWLGQRYHGVGVVTRPGIGALYEYQQVTRISGLFVLTGLGASLAGLAALRGPRRQAQAVLVYAAGALYLLPILAVSWDYRYSLPGTAVLWCAATVGVASVIDWHRGRDGRGRRLHAP